MHNTKKYRFWYLLTALTICILYFSKLLEMSMYIDGVWYAAISRNLSVAKGEFWFPQFSETIFKSFHEHPPLMFWLQSGFFRILGDSFLTERFFNLCIYLGTVFLLLKFWKRSGIAPSVFWATAFIPLFLWQFNTAAYFYFPANLLESQMLLFSGGAVLCLVKAARSKKGDLWSMTAGSLLFAACLTKGFVALFPLVTPFILYLIFKENTIMQTLRSFLITLTSLVVCFLLLFIIVPESRESLIAYLDIQVFASLNGERRLYFYRENRFFIIGQILRTTAPMFLFLGIASIALFLIKGKQKLLSVFAWEEKTTKYAVFYLLTALSASLPIMLSPRQALPYLLPALPFFALAVGLPLSRLLVPLWELLIQKKRIFLQTAETGIGILLICSLCWCAFKFKRTNQRDTAVIGDAQEIQKITGKDQIISSTHYDMYISGYLMRYGSISLDTVDLQRKYILVPKTKELTQEDYLKISINTKLFNLYQRKDYDNISSISDTSNTDKY